jgi:hypothetical protein
MIGKSGILPRLPIKRSRLSRSTLAESAMKLPIRRHIRVPIFCRPLIAIPSWALEFGLHRPYPDGSPLKDD